MPLSIVYKELFLIVSAACLWGHQWSAKRMKFCSDNIAVVEVLWSSTSRDSNLKVLLRHLSLLAAWHSFAFTTRHVSGKSNAIVDTIPRFEFQRFHQLAPYASPTATPVGLGPAACSLDQKCQFYLSNGLAPSTGQVYRSAQRQFICTLDGYVSSNGSLMNKPCLFCSHLADHFHHCSIKVYLSAIQSLHIDQGFPDPLVNCLQLQCPPLSGALSATKAQLSHNASQSHLTMRIIQHSLDTHNSEHVML